MKSVGTGAGVLLLLLQACVGDDPVVGGGPGQPDEDASTGTSSGSVPGEPARGVTLSVAPAEVVRGSELRLRIGSAWTVSPVDLELVLEGLPPGFAAGGPLILPAGQFEIELPVTVGAAAAFGDATIQVAATSRSGPALQARTSAQVLVRGAPGEIDTSFGDGGRLQLPAEEHKAATMRVDSAGRIWVTGYGAYVPEDDDNGRSVVVRYTPEGRLDTSFGSPVKNGVAIWDAPFGLKTGNFIQPFNVDMSDGAHRFTFCYSELSQANCMAIQALLSEAGDLRFVPPSKPTVAASIESLAGGIGDKSLAVVGREACAVQRLNPDGSTDPSFGGGAASIVPVLTGVSSCQHEFLGATITHLITYAVAFNSAHTVLWEGVTALDKATGMTIHHASTPPRSGTMRTDGVFVSASADRAFQKFDGARFTVAPSPLFVPASAFAALFSLPDAGVGALVTNETHAVQYFSFDANDQALAAPVMLQTVGTVLTGRDRTYARDGAVDSRRRLLVLMLQKPDETFTTDYPNPYWVVRRFWL